MIREILVVEDDKSLQTYLKELLIEHNFAVRIAADGAAAINYITKRSPDLIILDLGLPSISGETVVEEVRKKHSDIPIIILTGKDDPSDVIKGLKLGADDYITKPFNADILLARVYARLRTNTATDSILRVGDLVFDGKAMSVKRGNKQISLTPHEFKLLEYLLLNKNQVLSRDMILNRVWSYSPDVETRVVDVFMGYLRKKIDQGYKKHLIHSVRGFGYMIKE